MSMPVRFDVPVDPEPPEARDWLINELTRAPYQAAQPTLFDRVAKAISDWFASLQPGDANGPPTLGIAVIVTLVVVGLVVAFLIFGVPRLNRRSTVAGSLFGEDDSRNAAGMRADAAAAASRGDFTTAIEEMFRSIARGLAERTIVTTTPGTTARGFAGRAGAVFPAFAGQLTAAATSFDEVRYLGREGTEAAYLAVSTLEQQLRGARAQLEPVPA